MRFHFGPLLVLYFLQLSLDFDAPSLVVVSLFVVLVDLGSYLRPVVLLFSVRERHCAELEFPRALGELLDALAEELDVWLVALAEFVVFVDFIRLFPLKLHQLGQIGPSHHVHCLANLMVNHHGQRSLDEAVGLKHSVFQLLQLYDIIAKHLQFFLDVSLPFDFFFDFEDPAVVNLQALANLAELLLGLE